MIRILLTNKHLIEIGRQALDKAEWISYVKEYPNLRGVFSKQWGDPNNPTTQLDNFIKSFLTEDEFLFFGRLVRAGRISPLSEILKEGREFGFSVSLSPLKEEDDLLDDIFSLYPHLKETSLTNIERFLERRLQRARLVIPFLFAKLRRIFVMADLYEGLKFEYTQEFVTFYLKHVKILSRSDIFQICETVGDQIIERFHPSYFETKKRLWNYFKLEWNKPGFEAFREQVWGSKTPRFHDYLSKDPSKDIPISLYSLFYDPRFVKTIDDFRAGHISKESLHKTLYPILLEAFSSWKIRDARGNYLHKEYYQRHLSLKDLFHIVEHYLCKVEDFIFRRNILFYTLPRGGLETLGIFLYANHIEKKAVTCLTECVLHEKPLLHYLEKIHTDYNKIKENLQSLQQQDSLLQEKDIQDLETLGSDIKNIMTEIKTRHKEKWKFSEYGGFRDKLAHEDIRHVFILDDYFASGENFLRLLILLREHFKLTPSLVQEFYGIAIAKRRNLGDPFFPIGDTVDELQASKSEEELFYEVLSKRSFYGFQVEDIKIMIRLFPLIKRVLEGEKKVALSDTVLSSITHRFYYEEDEEELETVRTEKEVLKRVYIDKEWVDNLIITISFPHSIADGETEHLLRLLYGERFKHSVRDRINFLNILFNT